MPDLTLDRIAHTIEVLIDNLDLKGYEVDWSTMDQNSLDSNMRGFNLHDPDNGKTIQIIITDQDG